MEDRPGKSIFYVPTGTHWREKKTATFRNDLFFLQYINILLQLFLSGHYHKSILHSGFPVLRNRVTMEFRLFHPSEFRSCCTIRCGISNFHRIVYTSNILLLQNQNSNLLTEQWMFRKLSVLPLLPVRTARTYLCSMRLSVRWISQLCRLLC